MKQLLKWTAIGVLGGWAVISMWVTAILAVQSYITMAGFPPDLEQAVICGGIVGALFGLYKAGVRFHINQPPPWQE
jgi:hypothetical protein